MHLTNVITTPKGKTFEILYTVQTHSNSFTLNTFHFSKSSQNHKFNYQNKGNTFKWFCSSINMHVFFFSSSHCGSDERQSVRGKLQFVLSILLGAKFICSTDMVYKSDNTQTQTDQSGKAFKISLCVVFMNTIGWVSSVCAFVQAEKAVSHRKVNFQHTLALLQFL